MNLFRGRLIAWIFVSLLAVMLVMRLGLGKGKHRRFQDLARPVASLDLMAPPTKGWLNDHAVFFLREKNQGDFQCVSVDIHTLKETVIESLSPLLRDLEDRSQIEEIRASPFGQFLAVITGNADSPNRYLHNLISGQSELMMGPLDQHAWNQGVLHTGIPLCEKGLEIPTTRDGKSSRSGSHKGDRSRPFDISGSMASQHNRYMDEFYPPGAFVGGSMGATVEWLAVKLQSIRSTYPPTCFEDKSQPDACPRQRYLLYRQAVDPAGANRKL